MTTPATDATSTAEALSRKRRRLEARADAARARLARGLDALLDRKRALLDPTDELRRHPKGALVLAGTTVMLIAAGAGLVAYRRSTRKKRAHRERWDAWVRLVVHPESVFPRSDGFLLGMLERCASAALAATLAAVAKHFVAGLLEGSPDRSPPVIGLEAERDPFPSPAVR